MASPNIKDLLTSFSPASDFYAVSSADGRIKIWDTLRARLQMEFTNLISADAGFAGGILESKPGNGHLSMDYTCMQWVVLLAKKKKKKSKPGQLLLVLGTGSGDLLALDVSAAQLKWKISDCHPGGVTAIAFSGGPCIYTTGVDGVVCLVDSISGNLFQKFQVSRKAISSLAVSADGKMFATAAAQLKVFSSNNKKIQKFFGHPVGVCCMSFSEDGQFILSSGIGERYITFWKVDGSKNHSSCCVLSIEHPAVSLDCKGFINDHGKDSGLYLLVISEVGLGYFWHGKDIEELPNSKATKIFMSQCLSKKSKSSLPLIYSAKLQNTKGQAAVSVLAACGSIVKPSFERFTVQHGIDVNISCSQDSAFLPNFQSYGVNKDQALQATVTALDRANAEDAIIPLPMILEGRKRKHNKTNFHVNLDQGVTDHVDAAKDRKIQEKIEKEDMHASMEDRLKSVGILSCEDVVDSDNYSQILSSSLKGWKKLIDGKAFSLDSTMFKRACLLVYSNKPAKKIKEKLLFMLNGDAMKLLLVLIVIWKTRSASEQNVVSWICYVLVNHSYTIASQESAKQILEGLDKMTSFKCLASGPLLRLSGCLQLIKAQIIKAEKSTDQVLPVGCVFDESDDQDENIDEVVYGKEGETFQSSDEE